MLRMGIDLPCPLARFDDYHGLAVVVGIADAIDVPERQPGLEQNSLSLAALCLGTIPQPRGAVKSFRAQRTK
jgi:hypothetical protein